MDLNWQRPSPAMWRARLTLLAIVTVTALLAGGLGAGLGGDTAAGLGTAAAILVVAAAFAILLFRRYHAWGYAERDDDLLIRRGVMIRRLSVVPYGRMQFVDVTAGPIDRIFGLATVQLHTAAAATDAKIPGLTTDEAQRLRDQLASLGETQAAGL